jgi:hypothetical protein
MRSGFAGIGLLAATVGVTACGGGSTTAARGCFEIWNAKSNEARQRAVADRFTVADVSRWRAQAAGGVNLGGPASSGCGYLFHTSERYLSISAERRGRMIR